MALFRWIAEGEHNALEERLSSSINALGLEIDQELSNNTGIYAKDSKESRYSAKSRITVAIYPINSSRTEHQIEIRSSELMLSRDTRCEKVALALKSVIPSKS
jgi:hypothetical protein